VKASDLGAALADAPAVVAIAGGKRSLVTLSASRACPDPPVILLWGGWQIGSMP